MLDSPRRQLLQGRLPAVRPQGRRGPQAKPDKPGPGLTRFARVGSGQFWRRVRRVREDPRGDKIEFRCCPWTPGARA